MSTLFLQHYHLWDRSVLIGDMYSSCIHLYLDAMFSSACADLIDSLHHVSYKKIQFKDIVKGGKHNYIELQYLMLGKSSYCLSHYTSVNVIHNKSKQIWTKLDLVVSQNIERGLKRMTKLVQGSLTIYLKLLLIDFELLPFTQAFIIEN